MRYSVRPKPGTVKCHCKARNILTGSKFSPQRWVRGVKFSSGIWGLLAVADYLEKMGASTSHNPIGFHGLLALFCCSLLFVVCLVYTSILKTEVVQSSETSLILYRNTKSQIPVDANKYFCLKATFLVIAVKSQFETSQKNSTVTASGCGSRR